MDYNLERFVKVQNGVFVQVKKELENGNKTSHWMWFIFPQMKGLGYSDAARFYGITCLDEAVHYSEHPVLGSRLTECCRILLNLKNKTAQQIFGSIDALKLKSSMTLFWRASGNPIFKQILDLYYNGEEDDETLRMITVES